MYQYTPPKSSVWGHALKKMSPVRQQALFSDFLNKAAPEFSFITGVLQMRYPFAHLDRFENLLGIAAVNKSFSSLTQSQSELVLQEIAREEALCPGIMLRQGFEISAWSINGKRVASTSRVGIYYGLKPRLSTFFLFETIAQFQYVKSVLTELGLCTLNEKHLKLLKGRASEKV